MASTSAAHTQSMDNEKEDDRKSCTKCRGRISSQKYDKHTICFKCRGHNCLKSRCSECSLWSSEDYQGYIKHRTKLDSKARSKKAIRESKNSEGVKPNTSDVELSDSSLSDSINISAVGSSEESLSRSAVVDMISSSAEELSSSFSLQFSSAMSDAFNQFKSMIDDKFAMFSAGNSDNSNNC